MKKLISISVLSISALALSGCGGSVAEKDEYKNRFDFTDTGSSSYIYLDNKTGCKYLETDNGTTPLLNSNGSPDCSGSSSNDGF